MIFKLESQWRPEAGGIRGEPARQVDVTVDPLDTEIQTPHADAVVALTTRHWREGRRFERRPAIGDKDVSEYASGNVRDLFLAALDDADSRRTVDIARHLLTCGNPLPSVTCAELGLPVGSSYGAAARAVIAFAAAGR